MQISSDIYRYMRISSDISNKPSGICRYLDAKICRYLHIQLCATTFKQSPSYRWIQCTQKVKMSQISLRTSIRSSSCCYLKPPLQRFKPVAKLLNWNLFNSSSLVQKASQLSDIHHNSSETINLMIWCWSFRYYSPLSPIPWIHTMERIRKRFNLISLCVSLPRKWDLNSRLRAESSDRLFSGKL